MLTKQPYKNAVNIMVSLPQFWKLIINNNTKNFCGFCVWEGDKVPNFWLKHFADKKVKRIFVPSNHTRDAIINTTNQSFIDGTYKDFCNFDEQLELANIEDKIKIISHGVDVELFKPENEKHEKFTFNSCGGWSKGINDRKGMQYLLQAYCEEFKKDENVELLIKINPVYNNPNWNLNEELSKLNLNQEHASIKISTNLIDYKLLPGFYNDGDVFVSPNMGESFGLPIAEAMACGLPVITTGFGGQTDYVVDKENGFLIDYELIDSPEKPMYEEVKWAKPNIEHLKKLMRYTFEHQEEMKEMGRKAREKIVNEFQWKHSAEKLLQECNKFNLI